MEKVVVFDFDFTLGDSANGIIASVNYALGKLGYEKAEEDSIRKTIGLSLAKTLETLTGNTEDGILFEMYFKEKADEVMVAETTLYEGVREMLLSLHERGFKLAILTTKYHYRIEKILEVNHIGHLIDEIVGGDDVKNPKPDQEGMRLLSERLGVRSSQILYVGDSMVDARTAKASGTAFAAVLTGTTKKEEFVSDSCVQILEKVTDLMLDSYR